MSSAAEKFIAFVNQSPSPFHAVSQVRSRLESAGFKAISERDAFTIKQNGKYFFTRNQSSIVAFAVGGAYKPGNGFSVIGAHTDSPCLKVKPRSKKESSGYLKVGVELYGGGIWHSWFDRDLGVAGRVIVKGEDGNPSQKLVKINKPILRIPTLAIHLDRNVNAEGFKFNTESHLEPVLALSAKMLNGEEKEEKKEDKKDAAAASNIKHHPAFLNLLADEIGVQSADIGDFELCLFDTQPSAIGGLNNEFIFSPRIDNLMSSFCAIEALANSLDSLSSDPNIRVVALFDNEEVGSVSAYGAGSNLLSSTLARLSRAKVVDLTEAFSTSEFEEAMQKSLLISADCAHALHPNYAEKHEMNHRPMMNQGVVVKMNANQ
ncbi:hypothetical protein HK101_005165, partial [Irineochytrium annulatum]